MAKTSLLHHKLNEHSMVPIYKPPGLTSHDIVVQLRKITGVKKIGHAGTLDPMAEGILVVGIGRSATKQLGQFLKEDKEYLAEITFGCSTNTYDAEGKILKTSYCWKRLTKNQVSQAILAFIGTIEQTPPAFSAKKISGQKAYERARKGQKVDLKPSSVNIFSIDLLDWQPPKLTIKVTCSSGTYIRSLAHDLGQRLNCPAHLSKLSRTRVGQFTLAECIRL